MVAPGYSHIPELALSVRQPWAHAILHFGKDIENRSWRTNIRGPIALHASSGMHHDEYDEFCFAALKIMGPTVAIPEFGDLQRGGLIGIVTITDCITTSRSPWFFGPKGFVLANPQPIDFFPVRGPRGFFYWRKNLG